MKKLISLFAAAAMLSTVAIQASALENYMPTDNKYSFDYTDNKIVPGAYYGMVAVEGTGDAINTTDSSKFVYIDQATADSTGKISFSGFAPKGLAASDENYAESTVFIGGEGLDGAQAIGILRSSSFSETKEFIISGKIIDEISVKGATVTVMGAEETVATAVVEFTADAEGLGTHSGTYSITVPAGADYSVVITKDGYLKFTYTNVDVAADVALANVNVTLLAGDIDGDGSVILPDLQSIITDFNKSVSEAEDSRADIDGDGSIILPDLQALIGAFNGTNADFTMALPEATPAN